MNQLRVLVAGAALVIAIVGATSGAAPSGVISGTIKNGSAGASLPAELVVTAAQLDDQGNEVARRQGNAGSDGRFKIEGLDFAAGGQLIVGTDYLGVTYSAFVEVPDAANEVTAEITIFEPTEDESGISVLSDVLTIVPGRKGDLEVIQLLRIANRLDRTYVGAGNGTARAVLRLPLPQGARDFLPLEGIRPEGISEIAEGAVTGDPLLPGESSVSYVYRVTVARSGWPLERHVLYKTDRFDLLAEKTLAVSTSELKFEEEVTLEGKTYRRYHGGPFRAGEVLEVNIGSSAASNLGWGLAAGIGALFLIVMAGSLYRRRRGSPRATTADRQRLIHQIAELDEDYAAGGLQEHDYRRRRDAMKNRLESITSDLASAGR